MFDGIQYKTHLRWSYLAEEPQKANVDVFCENARALLSLFNTIVEEDSIIERNKNNNLCNKAECDTWSTIDAYNEVLPAEFDRAITS